ncbi:hypothetical protein FB451DRAFT_1396052 [Mycena latifolia]|nr:hypothetical protein FB451DRAFT_1396052 [Mycena latifolia]
MVALPQEIIDTVIDEIGNKPWTEPKDFVTLKTCSLTARAFLERSQRNIFRSLALKSATVAQVARCLADRRHLSTYVRALHLVDAAFGTESLCAPLILLFPLLDNLSHLAISSLSIDLHWSSVPADFRAVFVRLLSRPMLRCFALGRCWGVPSSIIRHALLSCKEVSLMDVGIYFEDDVFPYTDEIERESVRSPALDHLAVRYTREFQMSAPVHALILGNQITPRLQHLRHLEICVPRTGSLEALDILALKAAHSLQHLVIHLRQPLELQITLPRLPHLRCLTLRDSTFTFWPSSPVSTLARLPGCMPGLEVVNVFINVCFKAETQVAPPEVDTALQNLPHLHAVHFEFGARLQGMQVAVCQHWIREGLPDASDAGLIAFSTWDARARPPVAEYFQGVPCAADQIAAHPLYGSAS